MFSFRESYFRLVGLFDWGYARTQCPVSVSRNRYGFTLAGYQHGKSATDPGLVKIIICNSFHWCTTTYLSFCSLQMSRGQLMSVANLCRVAVQ